MNALKSLKEYILDMVESVNGVKVLILDEYTRDVVSVVTPFSMIMQKEVFLVDLLSNHTRQKLSNMRAIVFIRPTKDNAYLLKEELSDPKYQSYNVFFSNVVDEEILHRFAEIDKNEMVKSVFEYFTEYLALDNSIFSLNMPKTFKMMTSRSETSDTLVPKLTDGLTSVLLSLRKRPIVRYQKNSIPCKLLAQNLSERISGRDKSMKGIFDFKMDYETRYHTKAPPAPILLILDRRDDAITPLLTQWTYQAMIHELIGLNNNVIKYPSDEKREEVFTAQYDEFFSQNMYENWGDLCKNVKKIVDRYQQNHDMKENIQSIEDLANFMKNFPIFKKQQQEVEKHITMVTELRSIVSRRKLLDVSEVEQELVCGQTHDNIFEELKKIIKNENTLKLDALRLVIIYSLRYEDRKSELKLLKELLEDKGVEETWLVDGAIRFGGKSARTPGLFDEQPKSLSITSLFKKVASEFQDKEVSNVFTQHKPRLYETLEFLFKGKLDTEKYPFISDTSKDIPQEVIVFIVGGITYEEASAVELFNSKARREAEESAKLKANFGVISSLNQIDDNFKSVILGGTSVLNSKSFLRELENIDGH
ncbi:vacuolar protein sorting [Naegleria gruberi]|uniref:Vacuolar protein sorting n=1 Tax=Naegleria gruberi TaxID=5762 RepID=D2UXG2_NAEGR|nr:vacuolar protein sorting [Naegleria gruberi]EFC50279.1 vacuolar protein sorting [Naegleria gruberi]|eukprot:XP_002683023.1 vacuolar protein sorting [Naegleria gruberi strain NEG-M]